MTPQMLSSLLAGWTGDGPDEGDGSIRSPEWTLAHADHILPLDGPERREEGEWTFGYALEGRAVIDVWQVPPRAQLGGMRERAAMNAAYACAYTIPG
jgi:hypothetical protein